jgi:SRSO17 transposase
VEFRTKPQIAIALIDRALAVGIRVMGWTADEFYGQNSAFLNALDDRDQPFAVEIPGDIRVWTRKPKLLRKPGKNESGQAATILRLKAGQKPPSRVRDLARHSSAFHAQTPQRYRIRDSHKGTEIWEIRWIKCWRQTHDDQLVSTQCTLIVARNVLTGEVKYFLANQVPGRDGWTLRMILRIAFGRWPIEDCFREAKEELGLDHFECRSWHSIHRHLFLVLLSQLFCAITRQEFSPSEDVESGQLLTTEQVRRAVSVVVAAVTIPPSSRHQAFQAEANRQAYYAARNARAARSHRKKRRRQFDRLGIDPDKIKSLTHPDSQ